MISFRDLMKKGVVEKFRAAFIRDTGLSLSFSDTTHTEYNTYYAESKCEFCRLINSDEVGLARCKRSSRIAAKKAAASGESMVYHCWSGLTEVVVPVIIDDKHIANVFTGQVLTEPPSERDFEKLMRRVSKAGIDTAQLHNAYFDIPVIPLWRLDTIRTMLMLVVEYMVESEMKELLARRMQEEEKRTGDLRDYLTRECISAITHNDREVLSNLWQHLAFLGFESNPDTLLVMVCPQSLYQHVS